MRTFNTLEDEGLFFDWTDELKKRMTAARMEPKLRQELSAALTERSWGDALLSKLNHAQIPEILRADVVRALLVLDGTVRVVSYAEGRPEVA